MADFNFYLNRQGAKGNKGDKGDTGFSPYIEIDTNTAAEYKLKIVNEDNELITDNLRGSAVIDNGGTYMRYNPETKEMYAAPADSATSNAAGVIRIASQDDVEQFNENSAVTPAKYVDNLSVFIKSSDNSVIISQDEEDSKTDLSINFSGVEVELTELENKVNTHTSQISNIQTALGTFDESLVMTQADVAQNRSRIINLENNKVDKVDGKGLSTNDFTNEDKETLNSAIQPEDLADVATTGSYNNLIDKPEIPTLDNVLTINSTQDVEGTKTFLNQNLKIGNGTLSGVVAEYDSNTYNVYGVNGTSAMAGVVFGNTGNKALGANTRIKIYNANTGSYELAEIINGYNLTAGNNITITRNTSTGKYEISGSASYELPVASTVELGGVKIDGTSITIDSNGVISASAGEQSSFIPKSPLHFDTVTKYNVNNVTIDNEAGTIKSDGTGYANVINTPYLSSGQFYYRRNVFYTSGTGTASNVTIPYNIGQTVEVPTNREECVVFGIASENPSEYKPILFVYFNRSNMNGSRSLTYTLYSGDTNFVNGTPDKDPIASNAWASPSLYEVTSNNGIITDCKLSIENDTLIINYSNTNFDSVLSTTLALTDDIREALNSIDSAIFVFPDTTTTYPLSYFGVYDNPDNNFHTYSITNPDMGDNLFDLSGEVTAKYLVIDEIIDDATASSTTVFSSEKTNAQITSAVTVLAESVEDEFLSKTNAQSTYATKVELNGKQDISNLVTSLSDTSTDTQYPSAKCVYDLIGNIETLLSNI